MAEINETSPRVELTTSKGSIVLDLDAERAPQTVENFLKYVDAGHYDKTIFHRVIDDFMVQGGGFTAGMKVKDTGEPIENEAGNGLSNLRGTVAMARTSDPHSATAQFFINVVDNGFLDHKAPDERNFGYCVFGVVAKGMEVVDQIKGVKTGTREGMDDVPVEPVVIEKAARVKG